MCLNKCNKGVGLGELGSAPIKVYGTVLLLLCHVEGCTVLSKGGPKVNVKTHPAPYKCVFARYVRTCYWVECIGSNSLARVFNC